MLAIFIFLISIVLLSTNIHLYIRSKNDTIKVYIRIGMFYVYIPHHKIFSKLIFSKKDSIIDIKDSLMHFKSLTLNILSHSCINRIYLAKYTKEDIYLNPIENAMYYIFAFQFRGLLNNYFKYINNNNVVLKYDKSYENIDYYFDGYCSIFDLIYSSIENIIKKVKL